MSNSHHHSIAFVTAVVFVVGAVATADAQLVKVWYDLQHDGSDASQQDFGAEILSRMPTLLPGASMPNGTTTNLLDFTAGGAEHDFLTSKLSTMPRIGQFSDPFTQGADTAYEMNAVSWFSVVNSDDVDGDPQSRQYVISARNAIQDTWMTTIQDGDADTIANILNQVQDATPTTLTTSTSVNAEIDTWYIVGNSWDPAAQTLTTKILAPGATPSDPSTVVQETSFPTTVMPPTTANLLVRIGGAINSLTSPSVTRSLDGQIAEILVYNAALSGSGFDDVINYLDQKYFLAGGTSGNAPSASLLTNLNGDSAANFLVQPETVAGDFDSDGDVDGADFVAWQTNFPTAEGATLDQGDADGDSDVDGADFVVWQTNFPFTPGPGVAAVPEPSAWILGALGMLWLGVGRNRLRKNN